MQRGTYWFLMSLVALLVVALSLTTNGGNAGLAVGQSTSTAFGAENDEIAFDEDEDEEDDDDEDDDDEDDDDEDDDDEDDDDEDDELEEHHLELEIEMAHMRIGMAMFEVVERVAEVADDELKSAAFAVAHLTELVEEQEAIDLLEKALDRVQNPAVRRIIHMKLTELYAETDQLESAKKHLGKLIIGE